MDNGLITMLMSMDKEELAKKKTDKVLAKRLSEISGEKVYVKVCALSGDQYTDISTRIFDKKGKADLSKAYEVNALLAVEGVVEPSLKNSELMKHFGCATPKDLAKVIFPGGDLTAIADKITEISGFEKRPEEEEEEVKK